MVTRAPKYEVRNINALFDKLIKEHDLKNDRELAQSLGLWPANISKMRHGRVSFGDTILLNVHEVFGTPIKEIKGVLNGHEMV